MLVQTRRVSAYPTTPSPFAIFRPTQQALQTQKPAAIHEYPQAMNVPLDEVVRQLAKQPLLFQSGKQWSYSSAGIEILGRLIEVCSGQKYEDFMSDRISARSV